LDPFVSDVDDDGSDDGTVEENRSAVIVERTKLPSVSTESQTRIFLGEVGHHGITSFRGTVFAFIFHKSSSTPDESIALSCFYAPQAILMMK